MVSERQGGWTAKKTLAVVIPVCMAIAAVAVALVLTLGGKDDSGGTEKKDTASEEMMLETYEQIKQEAEKAVSEMDDLESEEAASDPDVYAQELEEAEAAYEQLYNDLEEATSYAVEVTEEYAELYEYIYEYYDYLYDMTEQATQEIDYLLSLVPTMEEIEQMQQQAERLKNLPAGGKYQEILAQLQRNAQKALSSLEGKQPPSGLGVYGEEMNELAEELESISQQMAKSLASGDKAAYGAQLEEMSAAIAQAQQQLMAGVDSLVSGYASMLSQLEASIQSALP